MTGSARSEPLLSVRDLRSEFRTSDGIVKAVDGVSFDLRPGELLGVVGESGSGKSVSMLSILRLLQPPGRITSGEVRFNGHDLMRLSEAKMRRIRGRDIAMIFQDPLVSLNPSHRIGWQVAEPLRVHKSMHGAAARASAIDALGQVGIQDPTRRSRQYPHEFSGGMRQRAMIAMALSTKPSVLIADEPTTSLDVTIQAQILELLRELTTEVGTATILVTHNLGVVAGMCERVIVMYAGRIVESGPTENVFANPTHPYTWALLQCLPRLDSDSDAPLTAIEGAPPDLITAPSGCKFHPRCAVCEPRCQVDEPSLEPIATGHLSRCWVAQKGGDIRGKSIQ